MKRVILGFMLIIGVGCMTGRAQVVSQTGDILGVHNLGAANSPVSGPNSAACLYCHAPHSGASKGPLWAQGFSSQSYSLYASDTAQNTGQQPEIGKDSSLCLSCHDGTIAPGQVGASGAVQVSGKMTSIFGADLQASHPFSLQLPIKDTANLVASLVATGKTADTTGAVKLIDGNIECTSCHDAHNQRIDADAPYFLVRDNHNGALCMACHETNARTVNGKSNPLDQFKTSIHATSPAQVASAAGLGGYKTVAEFACNTCHVPHNAGAPAGLLRKPLTLMTGVDPTSQSCFVCHDGGSAMVQPIANVLAEFQKIGHPYATDTNKHSTSEAVVLDQNRHATCADCHNSHITKQVSTFGAAPVIRVSQSGVAGAGTNGTALTGSAVNQYENCLRCHGTSTGKQTMPVFGYLPNRIVTGGDALNVISQMGPTATSAHPVVKLASNRQQPSLLKNMWDLTGTQPKRLMGSQIFCTDCHNSDDNREFGGTGPNGTHGSKYPHILERRYEMSQVATGTFPSGGPGSLITNLFPSPILTPGGDSPYALCAKCHDLTNVDSDVSFAQHRKHIQKGFSCSVCHTAHGVPLGSANVTGERLVNFDINVVAPANNGTLSYNNGSCTLMCHGKNHENRR